MPRRKENRVIIDTNIFISFLIGKRLHNLKDQIVNFKIRLLYSDQLIDEILIVTQRPKLIKYFPKANIDELIDLIHKVGDNVLISKEPDICRDPKDNFMLAIADKGRADFLITGDRDLISLIKYKQTKIISYKDFEKLISTKA